MNTPTTHDDDRGLAAVRRVRVARENDSRIGLQHALADAREATEAAGAAQNRLSAAPGFGAGAAPDFQLHRQLLATMATDQLSAEDTAATSARVADEARRRWVADRTAVRTAELLLDRRAAVRAEDLARREAAQLDDLAATGWLRRKTQEQEGPG